jgi:uncharacterized membrane protein YjjB (DUF3815 family)
VATTALAGIVVGTFGRILARRAESPAVLWVVPASLPLLPGLLIVNGMLSANLPAGLLQLSTAVATALALGAAVAFGDIVVQTLRTVRDEIIDPAMQPVGHVVQAGIDAVTRPRGGTMDEADKEKERLRAREP